MLAIAGEIVVVVLAAVAGAGAGWLLARRGRDRVIAAAREEATAGTLSLADALYARTQRLHAVEARLVRAQEQLAGRTGALAATTERIKAIENEAEVASREFAALEHERGRLAARVAELVARVAELEPVLDGLRGHEAALAEAAFRLRAADADAAARAREIERLEGALGMRESQLEGLHARIATLEPLEAALAEREARIRELEAALPAPASAPAMAAASPATRLPELPGTARRKRAPNGSQRDDLKRIPGIGPATERVLHSFGVYTFRQIANWRREDLEAITAKLGDSPARLKQDDWIDGARREHVKKYGEAP
jgi:predicted flap endonuclease-1-like 5' DNA nuclease